MKMKMLVVVVAALLVVFLGSHEVAAAASTQEKCGADFQKLAVCLTYATGKAAVPTKGCCDSVKGIKDSEPECLCFIMQQTHKGDDQIKSMGIQESKLLSLPTACALKNATLAECPNVRGRVISWSSAGTCGFKGTKRGTPFAAQTAAENAIRTVVDQGMQRAEVMIKGPGLGRDAALRAIRRSELLGLPANSPDAAIFTNASTTASATPAAKETGASQSQTSMDASSGARLGTHLSALLAMAMAVTAIAFFAFP